MMLDMLPHACFDISRSLYASDDGLDAVVDAYISRHDADEAFTTERV